MISSEDTTPLILFHEGKVFSLAFRRCCQTRPSIETVFPVNLHSSRFLPLAIKQMFKMSQNSPACLLHSSFVVIYLPPGDDLLQVRRGGKVVELHET